MDWKTLEALEREYRTAERRLLKAVDEWRASLVSPGGVRTDGPVSIPKPKTVTPQTSGSPRKVSQAGSLTDKVRRAFDGQPEMTVDNVLKALGLPKGERRRVADTCKKAARKGGWLERTGPGTFSLRD